MICNNCGLTLKDTARFCAGCGIATSRDVADLSAHGGSTSLSPVSALIADSQLSSSTVSCVIHSSTTATGTCIDCRNFFCRDCTINIAGKNYCRGCAHRRAEQPQSPPPYSNHLISPSQSSPQP